MEAVKKSQPSDEPLKGLSLPRQKSNQSLTKQNRLITKNDRNTATVSKITKLTMKPKPMTKTSNYPTRLTTKKYNTGKPVTIKSRSTVISHESTFCIKNIRKSPKRQNVENASQSNHIQSTTNTWNGPQKNQILQEITSAVVNHSYTSINDPLHKRNSCKFEIDAPVRKPIKLNGEHSPKCKANESPGRCKVPASKEEIKRRLSALQRNSLKILENNVQKARKCSIVTTSKVEVIQKQVNSGTPTKSKSTPIKNQSKRKSSHTPVTPSKFLPTVKTNKDRIGILRRPEGASPKTVQNQLVQKSSPPQLMADKATDPPPSLQMPNNDLKMAEFIECHANESNIAKDVDDTKPNQIPYWLRPTPVQPYPYNFILAVRKKLESITNPVLRTRMPQPASIDGGAGDSSFSIILNRSTRPSPHETMTSSSMMIESMGRNAIHVSNHIQSMAKEQSRHTPEHHRNASQDTLSISSGILSYSNPEKKLQKTNSEQQQVMNSDQRPISPMTMDNIDGRSHNSRISDITNQSHISSHINFERGNSFDRQPSLNDLNGQNDVHKLLKDFNESLSQVIKVNQYLHGILSNPPSSRTDEKESTKYSNDFEEAITTEQSSIDEEIQNRISSEKSEFSVTEPIASSNVGTSNTIQTINIETNKSNGLNVIQSSESNNSTDAVEENIEQISDSPTNNDLKSISLSIAKKSIATEDDTNATESYRKHINSDTEMLNQSIGSDIFIMFNKTSMGLGDDLNTSTWSIQNLSYSSLGVCDQLLKSEIRKSDDLVSLLKIREKSLIDRFKGQVAWLELHKQKLKKSGRITEISMIKKKQRALLLRLNQDRKELHRIIKERQLDSSANELNVNYNISHMSTNMSIRRQSMNRKQSSKQSAIKALELPGGGSALEFILQKRENELRHRREHVEKLLNWHQRLDHEEREVIKLEQMLMVVSTSDAYQTSSHEQINDNVLTIAVNQPMHHHHHQNAFSSIPIEQTHDSSITKSEQIKRKQINKIEKSLNTLKSISGRSASSNADGSDIPSLDDVVEIVGRQLNKLWKRLTGQNNERFIADQMYRLTKADLEKLYEKAKLVVLNQFDCNDEFKRRLIDGSMSIIDDNDIGHEKSDTNAIEPVEPEQKIDNDSLVPALNLASSSPEPSVERKTSDVDQGYYFSNNSIDKIESVSIEPNNVNNSSNSDDSQSDITEDSLNNFDKELTSIESPEIIQTETVETVESSTAIDKESIPLFELNVSQNDFQLIEDTSFPNIDMQLTLPANLSASVVIPEEISSELPSVDNMYQSEKFEEAKSTSISTDINQQSTDTEQSNESTVTEQPNESTVTEQPNESTVTEQPHESTVTEQPNESTVQNDSSKDDNDDDGQVKTESPQEETASPSEEIIEESKTVDESIQTEPSIDDEHSTESSTNNDEKINQDDDEEDNSSEKSVNSIETEISTHRTEQTELSPQKRQYQYSMSSSSIDYNKVPEADALKRSLPIESETKSTEQSSVFPFLREIPNKPPPPYPAHRQLQKTPPFPSDDRIKELVFQRIEELFQNATIEPKPQTPLTPATNPSNESPVITTTPNPTDATFVCSPIDEPASSSPPNNQENVFERIILDCCAEIMEEIKQDSKLGTFRQPLAFYNPPNRLLCFQEFALKRIFKLLNRPRNNDGNASCLPPRVAQLSASNRRKRDAVDDILIQELYEDEAKWTNFFLEEEEVRQSVGGDLRKLLVDESLESNDQSNTTTSNGDGEL